MPPNESATQAFQNPKQNTIVSPCSVSVIGLETFINTIVKEINLNMNEYVEFNLNDRGLLYKWKDVFEVESAYTKCLGISKRFYEAKSYTWEPEKRLTYFILEEYNQRSIRFLPGFSFHVLVFCWYDENRTVTRVSVQYDQMSFFLHVLGLQNLHRFLIGNVLTPPARIWAQCFLKSGMAHPLTFLFQLFLFIYILYYLLFIYKTL